MHAPYNPFARQKTALRAIEAVFRWSLRLATYAVVVAASYFFILITLRGGGYVLQPRNFPFLWESPESLRILTVGAQTVTLNTSSLANLRRFTPNVAFFQTAQQTDLIHVYSVPASLSYSLTPKKIELSSALANKLKTSPAEVISFEPVEAKLVTFTWKKKSYELLDNEYDALVKKQLALDTPAERKALEGQFIDKKEREIPLYRVKFVGNSPELNSSVSVSEEGRNLLMADFIRVLEPSGTRSETYVTGNLAAQTMRVGDRAYRNLVSLNPQLNPSDEKSQVYAAGGIFPNIMGTIILTAGSIVIALTLGILAAIYLSEYSRRGMFLEIVRLAILNLSGVPSIVFGMFGYGMFVILFGWNTSLLAGWFTLAFMVMPIIITASEESLRAVPQGYREASLALGATKWQTIQRNVLPYALPGILTSSVLGIARVAGETAPIMFTAAYVLRDELPWQVAHFTDFFFQGVMALPYHIFVVSARVPQNQYTEEIQYATAFVFLAVVMIIALASIILRNRVRNRLKW